MKYSVCCEETNNKMIIIERSVWTGKSNLYVNNTKLTSIGKNVFLHRENDDTEVEYILKGNEFSGIVLYINNQPITVLRKLNALELILTLIPIVLLGIGGAIGGALAGLGMVVIALSVRKFDKVITKILFSIVIYLIISITWYILASAVLGIIN